MSTKVLGYIRVSQRRGREGPSFISPTVQREHIERWAAANDCAIVDIITEIDESGGRHDRPGLVRCVEAIESGEVDGMVVARLDRYFRDQLGGHTTMARIKDARGFLAVPGDGIDTRFDTGKMMFGFLLTIAEGELDRYRRQFADARGRAVARGVHPCPVPPLGYTRALDDRGKVISPLQPHDVTGPVVTELYKRRAAGEALADIARWLERREVRSAYGAPVWTGRAVRLIVRNRVYLGEARHGEFVNPDAHEPLTDEMTWRRAQRPGTTSVVRGTRPALLAGIVRCAGCQFGMRTYLNRHGLRTYACHRRHAGGDCPAPASTSTPRFEELVLEAFWTALGDPAASPATDTTAYEAACRARDEAVEDLVTYRDDPGILRAIGGVRFAEGLEVRQQRVGQAEAAVDAAMPAQSLGLDVATLRDCWDTMPIPDQRRHLKLVFDCVFLRRGTWTVPIADRVHFCAAGTMPKLPGPGMRPAPAPVSFVFPDREPLRPGMGPLEVTAELLGDSVTH